MESDPAAQLQALLGRPDVQLAVLAVAATIVLLLVLKLLRSGSKSNLVLLVGPCNAGKTTLFYQLKDGTAQPIGAVASMHENEDWCHVKDANGRSARSFKLVDIPGHPRLRSKGEQYLKDAAAVILVIDAADITPHKTEAAEELFEVLTHPAVARRRTPVLLACNKADLETQAHSVDFIRRTVEKQLDTMRKTRLSLGSDAGKAAVLGKPDKALSLAALRSPIHTASVSAEKGDVAEVMRFLSAL